RYGIELAKDEIPADLRLFMSEDFEGNIAADIVANACNFLIVSRRIKEVFENFSKTNVQYLPVNIYDQEKKFSSGDYFIVNPLIAVSLLNREEKNLGEGGSIQIYEYDSRKTKSLPDLFRVSGLQEGYVLSPKIREQLRVMSPIVTSNGVKSMQ